jgi:4-amino-4-deoxy-L-arabinose transferase-like glycosyltransferase
VLILATLGICYFTQLGVIGFVGPDEPRYAWIARAMAETGDWVTPRLYGQPWFEKPVLYYWEAALSFKIFGVSEAAARLPSALSALAGTLALAWLAWRIYGRDTARWLLILLPSSVGMIGFSHAAATDMPFAAMITVAMVCAAVCLRLIQSEKTPILPRTPWLGLICFGFFLGLAVLAKGPAAIILCGGAIFFWAIITKRWRDAFSLLHPAAILVFCLTALPWYVICARRNPDFFRIFIIEHNFKRYLTPEFQHTQPFWYYVPVLLVAFLPWAATLVWAAIAGSRAYFRARRLSAMTGLLLCWAGFCLVFFSISRSKLPGYILPAFPAVGLLIARSVVLMTHRTSAVPASSRGSYASYFFGAMQAGALIVFSVLYLLALFREGPQTFVAPLLALRLVLLLFAMANMLLAYLAIAQGRPRNVATSEHNELEAVTAPVASRERIAMFACAPILLAVLSAGWLVHDFFPRDPSGRTAATALEAKRIPGNQLFVAGMNRSMRYSLSFYLHNGVREWDTSADNGGYLLTAKRNCAQVAGPGLYCEEQPFDPAHETGRFLYLVIPIADESRNRQH